jgi:hypothetical protein
MKLLQLILVAVIVVLARAASPFAAAQSGRTVQSSDFEFFRTRVEPIFLKKRAGHGRCVVCHATGGAPGGFGLQPLSSGTATWTEEQSRKNFELASEMIAPGDPTSSALLMHPLSPLAGGDVFHGGGRQFESQDDPDWRVLADWVRQQKAPEYTNLKILEPAQVGRAMEGFNVALGVDCTFCHGRDFASDANPHKEIARRMLQMTRQINTNFKVSCFTCHRGQTTPKLSPDPFTDTE